MGFLLWPLGRGRAGCRRRCEGHTVCQRAWPRLMRPRAGASGCGGGGRRARRPQPHPCTGISSRLLPGFAYGLRRKLGTRGRKGSNSKDGRGPCSDRPVPSLQVGPPRPFMVKVKMASEVSLGIVFLSRTQACLMASCPRPCRLQAHKQGRQRGIPGSGSRGAPSFCSSTAVGWRPGPPGAR